MGHLRRLGYRIAARNVRIGRVEVDLIARRGTETVFCEVKTRRSGTHGLPEESVNARKRARIVRAASAWLARHPPAGNVRFDVLSVVDDGRGAHFVRHIADAFRPW